LWSKTPYFMRLFNIDLEDALIFFTGKRVLLKKNCASAGDLIFFSRTLFKIKRKPGFKGVLAR